MSDVRAIPLSRKLPLLVLALLVGVLIVTLGVSYYEVRQSAMLSAGERLTALSRVLNNVIEPGLNTRAATMRRVASTPSVVEAFRDPSQPASDVIRKAMSPLMVTANDSAAPPELWSPEGRPIGAAKLELPADRRRFADAIRSAKDSVQYGRITLDNGRASFLMAVPVREADGRTIGYLVQERRLATNPRNFQGVRDLIGSDIDIALRNKDDDLWVRFDGSRVPPPSSSEPALDSLRMLDRGTKGRSLSATVPVRGTPFLITVERPQQNILARPLAAMRVLIVISILLAVVGAVVAWLISRRLVRPLKDLTAAAESMAQGDYQRRVAINARDEVGRLGGAFNRMAEQVQVSSDASARALAQLTRAMETQEFLAEASRILAGSLSDDAILADLARYCVPTLGDYCTMHIADDDGGIRRIETAHRDPAQLPRVKELVTQFTYRMDRPGEIAEVIRSQQPMLVSRLDFEGIRARITEPHVRELFDEVRPHSFMCVPLVARGRAFGAISFTTNGDDAREFGEDDVEIAMELARRASGAIDNAVIYKRSVTLRMEAEAASNAKSDFLAKMSHEIRTPINAMLGYAELIQMGISGPVNEQQSKQLGRIRASGDHLTALVNEILDLAKIEAGQMLVQSSVGIAGDAAEAALTLIRPIAARKGVEVTSFIDQHGPVEYVGDAQRVQQILTNLLSNAVKFTSPGGRVSVGCSRASRDGDRRREWACIRVEDTGMGIRQEDIDRIFHPFVQVESGYTRSQGGTGLGLTISRSLANLMGGEITVESTPGVGSAFMLWLPCPNRALTAAST